MRTFFVAPIQNLAVEQSVGRGFVLRPGYFLTNDSTHVKELLSESFRGLAGDITIRAVLGSQTVFFFVGDLPFSSPPESSAEVHIRALLEIAGQFISTLWLVKDNSVMLHDGHLEYPYRQRSSGVFGMSHSLGRYYWNSAVTHEVTPFSLGELRRARELGKSLHRALELPEEGYAIDPTLPLTASRLARVWYLVETARMAHDVALRIAQYVTALEALYSNDYNELSHQLSE